MSTIDTINSSLSHIADELFTELTPEVAEVIGGGHALHAYGKDENGKFRILSRANNFIKRPKYNNKYTDIYISEGTWRVYDQVDFNLGNRTSKYGYRTLYAGKWYNLENMSWVGNNIGGDKTLDYDVSSFERIA